jgi:hypothetical protein
MSKAPRPAALPQLAAMLDQLKSTGGVSYKAYSSAGDLESLLAADLAVLLSERFTTRAEPATAAVPRPPSEFVGRQAALVELASLVTSEGVRLVTLTGPGGIGKTRLAIEVASAVADRFPDATVFVPLAGRGPGDFLEAISTAVGLKDLGQRPLAQLLADHLRDRRGRKPAHLTATQAAGTSAGATPDRRWRVPGAGLTRPAAVGSGRGPAALA